MSLTTATQSAIDAQPGDFFEPEELRFYLRWWFWFCVWFFGTFTPSGRLLPFRRWLIRAAFNFRFMGQERLSNACWKWSKVWAVERTHPALAAYATKLLMPALMDGRERVNETPEGEH